MAAVLGDLLQITAFQTLSSQQVLNVYHYRVTSVTGFTNDGYDAILDWFEDEVLAVVRVVQHSALSYNRLLIQNLSNGVDFVDRALSPALAGLYTSGGVMPPFVSYGFRLIRETLVTRNGYKRFGGVPEEAVTAGVYINSMTDMTNIADALASDIVIGVATLAEPIIVKRPILSPAGAYQYSSIGDSDYRSVGTQNTRKIGRGN